MVYAKKHAAMAVHNQENALLFPQAARLHIKRVSATRALVVACVASSDLPNETAVGVSLLFSVGQSE
jgi:hypothetical protein